MGQYENLFRPGYWGGSGSLQPQEAAAICSELWIIASRPSFETDHSKCVPAGLLLRKAQTKGKITGE